MLTRAGCLKTEPAQQQFVRVHIVHGTKSYLFERLPLEYMQTHVWVYYNPHTDVGLTRECSLFHSAVI